jgi:regulator of sigma E protease
LESEKILIDFLINALKIVFLLGLLILIHEGGHFIIAKLSKVKVNEFAIGFGPTIFKKQKAETVYALRLIPLGGFVNMEGEEKKSDEIGSYSKAPMSRRIAIVLAGGFVNILFGILVYFALVSFSGNYISNEISTVINEDMKNYGITAGDKILEINNNKIRLNSDVKKELEKSDGNKVNLLIQKGNEEINADITPKRVVSKNIGVYFGKDDGEVTSEVMMVYPNSPSEIAGIRARDVILKIDDKDVKNDPYKVVEYMNQSQKDEITVTIKRNEEEKEIIVKPDIISTYFLGVEFKTAENNFQNNIYYGFWDTINFSLSIIDNLKMLFTGNVRVNQLIGPIGISEMVAETNGLYDFLYILSLISLSLGITNLLPFPPLDGGKVVILLIEAIRKKPLKESIETNIQMLGFAILIALSIYVAYNDILRIF